MVISFAFRPRLTKGTKTESSYLLSQHAVIKRTCLEAKKRPRNQAESGRFKRKLSFPLCGENEAERKHLLKHGFKNSVLV